MGETGSCRRAVGMFAGDFTMPSIHSNPGCRRLRPLSSYLVFSIFFIMVFGVRNGMGEEKASRDTRPFHFTMDTKREVRAVDGIQDLLLLCQVSVNQGVQYMWEQDGKPIVNTTRRHQVGPNLSISPVLRQRDQGNFTCRATRQDGFTLISEPQSINFIWINAHTSVHLSTPTNSSPNLNQVVVEPGVDVILTCHVDGTSPLTYTWFRNGEPIVASGSVVTERSLHLRHVNPRQSGSYACEANNVAGNAEPDGLLHVIIPGSDAPRLIRGPENVIETLGSKTEFHCEFDSSNVEVQWSFVNNGLILNSSRHIVYSNGTLVLDEIETSDAGMYKCLANFIMEPKIPQVYSAYLRVSYLEQLTLSSLDAPADALTPDGKLGVREGSRVEIFCRKPNGFPIPLIYWEDPSGKRMSETVTNDTRDLSLLLIENIQSNQAGGYSCVAQNPAAITRIIVEIVITTEPSIQTHPKTAVIVDEGKSAVLTCLFESGDLYRVRWLRNGVEVPHDGEKPLDESTVRNGRIRIQQYNGGKEQQWNSTLVIKPVGLTDAGNYTCEIITPGFPSVHSRPAQLFVTEMLKFQPRPIDRKLELGSNSKIHCKAYGSPPPIVRWLKPKDGEPFFQIPSHLIDVNGTLHFPNVALSDAGLYVCVASNPQGIINSSITVDVIEPPKFLVTPRNPTDAVEGQSVLIDCQAHGNPKPTIQWDKETDLNGFDHNRFRVLKNGSLYITKVLRGDMGHYGCVAGNSGGFKREEVRLVVKSSDEFVSESIDDGNLMTRTVSITLSVATGYMLLVIGLMLWCRYRQLQRKQAHLAETCKENGDCEMRETIPKSNGTSGSIIQNGRTKKQAGCGVKSEAETVKSTHSSVGNGRAASVTASIASHRSQISQHSKRSVSSGYDRISYPRQQLQFVMLLGHGEFGDVFLARAKGIKENETESLVMVKSLETREETALFNFKREIDMYYKLNHDNICRLIKLCRDVDPHYMIMEYSDWGDLKQFLLATREQSIRKVPKPPNLTMTQVVQVVSQIALGMENLSNNRLVHKDLATRNCLISSGIRIKISNPGLSKDTYANEYHNFRNQVIPLRWLPPEAIFDDDYSTKTDVWAFAVLAWEVIHQAHIPFETQSNLTVLDRLERKDKTLWNPVEMSDLVPKRLVELMTKCWDYCPTNRPSFSSIAIELDEILRDI